jgi:hypothetical protein
MPISRLSVSQPPPQYIPLKISSVAISVAMELIIVIEVA